MKRPKIKASCEHSDRWHYAKGKCKLCYDREFRKTVDWPSMMRRYNLNKYGITEEIYSDMLAAQNHKCKICGCSDMTSNRGNKLHIDHDHSTGKVRGLLCAKCNTGLGAFKDNIAVLYEAISYLQYYSYIKRD